MQHVLMAWTYVLQRELKKNGLTEQRGCNMVKREKPTLLDREEGVAGGPRAGNSAVGRLEGTPAISGRNCRSHCPHEDLLVDREACQHVSSACHCHRRVRFFARSISTRRLHTEIVARSQSRKRIHFSVDTFGCARVRFSLDSFGGTCKPVSAQLSYLVMTIVLISCSEHLNDSDLCMQTRTTAGLGWVRIPQCSHIV
jgi:hypothetical protein